MESKGGRVGWGGVEGEDRGGDKGEEGGGRRMGDCQTRGPFFRRTGNNFRLELIYLFFSIFFLTFFES